MRYHGVPSVQQATPRDDDGFIDPVRVGAPPDEGAPPGAAWRGMQRNLTQWRAEQMTDYRERLVDRRHRQQHRGRATTRLAAPSPVRVTGDVHAHARPPRRSPEQRQAYLNSLKTADRHRLRVAVEQPVPQPNAVAGKRKREAVVALQALPGQSDRCDRRG